MSEPDRARVFLVEDHPLMLFGIEKYLEDRYELVGSASEVKPAVDLVLERRPDLVLLDVRIPGGGGAAVIEAVKKQVSDIKFLAFTVSTNAEDVKRLFEAGVDGYVVKTTEGFQLAEQIDQVELFVDGEVDALHPLAGLGLVLPFHDLKADFLRRRNHRHSNVLGERVRARNRQSQDALAFHARARIEFWSRRRKDR
ncbi:MAG: response regulator transcription factor, partial [Acidobacteria bacterium]|nr:response regulator transcription factor [Acidobacteriota bacterium]